MQDANVTASLLRIWKTNASAKLGPIDTRERQSMEYRRKLREKWGNEKGVREIERYVLNFPLRLPRTKLIPIALICRQRRLPSNIKNAAALKKTMLDARKTKDENRRRHTREGLVKPTAERKSECPLLLCRGIILSDEDWILQRSWLPSNVRFSPTVFLQRFDASFVCIILSSCIVPSSSAMISLQNLYRSHCDTVDLCCSAPHS
jgi:hypothetical protein